MQPPNPRHAPGRPLRSCVLLGLGFAACGGEAGSGGLEPPPPTGALAVSVTGLPTGTAGQVQVTGPGGFARTITATEQLRQLEPGSYSVSAANITATGHLWSPSPAAQDVPVTANAETQAAVQYRIATGALSVTVTGLPAGASAALTLSGPGGFSQVIAGSTTLVGLVPGAYALSGSTVSSGAAQYAPLIPVLPAIAAAIEPAEVTVEYSRQTGSIALAVTGLPPGVDGALALTGPGGFAAAPSAGGVLNDLDPGTYTLTATAVQDAGNIWAPGNAAQTITVSAGASTGASVSYALTTGGLNVTLSGLPPGATAPVLIAGPAGFSQTINASTNLKGLAPGSYSITAPVVNVAGQPWQPVPPTQQVNVVASLTPATASVAWSQATGSLAVAVTGLPGGTSANVIVTGPGGFTVVLTASQTLKGVPAGDYTIAAANVSGSGQTWAATPPTQSITVPAGASAGASVAYSPTLGALAVTISGLPGGTKGNVTITGPGGFSQGLGATATLHGLTPGSYTVAASNVTSGATTYTPAPPSQARTVSVGATATASVGYTSSGSGGGSLNLRIDGLYLTQAAQRYNGTVPLVAGRDGYLRVFVLANQANTAQPQVRVRLYAGGSLAQTYTINAPASSVPLAVNEGSLTASWNVLIPAALMQPGLTVLADVDPGEALAETDESDNKFPASGTAGAVDVRALPTFNLRFVPVLQSANSLQGDVTVANAPSFLATLLTLLPVGGYNADVRAAYTTSAPALVSDNANGAWGTILSEILALKSTDASTRYYYGVVKTSYSSGVAGMGYVGGGARTSIGWDRLSSAPGVMAHEVGHNMGRNHAPCGGAGGPDPGYPHSGGSIGIWGLDVASLQLKDPGTYFDLMGYCDPDWVSDYNWSAMLTYRQGGPNNVIAASAGATVGRGLLVWGRITSTGLVLEPAFAVDGADLSAPPAGPHLIEARDGNGAVLFSIPFAASEASDSPTGREEAFAFVVPAAVAFSADIAELRLVSGGRSAASRPAPVAPPAPSFIRGADGRGLLQWNASAHPMVLVRDVATGRILSFARGGSVRLPAGAISLDATFSDGTRSRRVLIQRN